MYFSHKEEYDESFLQSAKSASEFGGECVNSLESELCKKFNRKYAVATLTDVYIFGTTEEILLARGSKPCPTAKNSVIDGYFRKSLRHFRQFSHGL